MLLRAAFAWRCQLIQCCCLCPGTLAPSLLRHPANAHKDAKLLAWLCCYSAFVSPQTVCVGMCVCVCVRNYTFFRYSVLMLSLWQDCSFSCSFAFVATILFEAATFCCLSAATAAASFLYTIPLFYGRVRGCSSFRPHPPHYPLRYRPSCESRWY